MACTPTCGSPTNSPTSVVFTGSARPTRCAEATTCSAVSDSRTGPGRAGDTVDKLSGGMQQRVQLAAAGQTVIFSSHQLDLVEDLCESIVMIHHGRVVLAGRVTELKAASGERRLRIRIDGPTGADARSDPPSWLAGLRGVELLAVGPGGMRLRLEPQVDALAVLDAARGAGPVADFALEEPPLSQLFLRAAGESDPLGTQGDTW